MLVVRATFPIDSNHRDDALEQIGKLVEHSQNEDGVISYQVATDVDDPNRFRFFEQYEDESAFEAHAESDHFQEFEATLPTLLAGEPEATQFNVAESSTLEL